MTQKYLGLVAIAVFALALPLLASAASFPYWGESPPILACTGLQCRDLCQLLETAANVVYFMMTLAVFVFAPVLIVIGGIMVMVGGASPSRLSLGKSILWGTLVGIALAVGAFFIVNSLYMALGQSFGNLYCNPSETPGTL